MTDFWKPSDREFDSPHRLEVNMRTKCPKCKSESPVAFSSYIVKGGVNVLYQCKACGKVFSLKFEDEVKED